VTSKAQEQHREEKEHGGQLGEVTDLCPCQRRQQQNAAARYHAECDRAGGDQITFALSVHISIIAKDA